MLTRNGSGQETMESVLGESKRKSRWKGFVQQQGFERGVK